VEAEPKETGVQVTTLTEIEEALGGMDPDTLREMAYRMALSHVALCETTSQIGDWPTPIPR